MCNSDDIVRLCDQGDRIRKLTVTDPTESNKYVPPLLISITEWKTTLLRKKYNDLNHSRNQKIFWFFVLCVSCELPPKIFLEKTESSYKIHFACGTPEVAWNHRFYWCKSKRWHECLRTCLFLMDYLLSLISFYFFYLLDHRLFLTSQLNRKQRIIHMEKH